MFNKQRCTNKPNRPKVKVMTDASKAGNPVSSFGDTANMEYKPVPKNPSWKGKGEQKDWA